MAAERVMAQDEVYEFLTSQPSLEEIIRFRCSADSEERLRELLESNRNGTLTQDDKAALDEYVQMEHFMRMLKLRARQRMAVR